MGGVVRSVPPSWVFGQGPAASIAAAGECQEEIAGLSADDGRFGCHPRIQRAYLVLGLEPPTSRADMPELSFPVRGMVRSNPNKSALSLISDKAASCDLQESGTPRRRWGRAIKWAARGEPPKFLGGSLRSSADIHAAKRVCQQHLHTQLIYCAPRHRPAFPVPGKRALRRVLRVAHRDLQAQRREPAHLRH